MRHRLYTGSFAELEHRWLQELTQIQLDDPLRPVAVVVGSNILAIYLKRRVAESGPGAANLRFYTFWDLASRLGGKNQNPRLPHAGSSAILASILASSIPPAFASIAVYAGFKNSVLETFRDLRDAGLNPEYLDDNLQSWIGLNPDRREHLLGLSQLYRRFRGAASTFTDVDEVFRLAIGHASSAAAVLDTDSLAVYGIYDATRQQSDLLARLSQALNLTYFVPLANEAVSAFALPFVRLRSNELNVSAEALGAPPARHRLGKLKQIGFGLADQPSKPAGAAERLQQEEMVDSQGDTAADGSVLLVSAPGESRVAVEVAREVLRAVRDGVVVGFFEAAVILRQPEQQVPALTEAFRLRGIPYFVQGGRPFSDRPLSKAVLAICALDEASFSRQAIFTAMELISAALPVQHSIAWKVPEWRLLTNDARFLAGINSWDEGARALIAAAEQELSRAQRRTREPDADSEGERCLSTLQARKELELAKELEQSWKTLRAAAAEWPEALSWQNWAELFEQRFEPALGASEDWQSFSMVLDELSALSEVFRRAGLPAAVTRARVITTLRESLSALSHPEGQFQRSGVNLLPVAAARGLRFPLVIIPGLDEGWFPAAVRQDPLLLDIERSRIAAGALPLKTQRAAEERLLFDMAARSAEKRLVLMTSRLDESSDRERLPSQFFMLAASAVCGHSLGLRDLTEDRVPGFRSVSLENPAPQEGEIPVDEGEIRLRFVCGAREAGAAAVAALVEAQPDLLRGPDAFDRARWNRRLTAYDGLISDATLQRWIAGKVGPAAVQFSASRLEEYAKCPYYFYLKRVIELEGWEQIEPVEGMDPLQRGEVIHSILEDFVQSLLGARIDREAQEPLRDRLAFRARRALAERRPPGIPDLLWDVEQDRLLELLQNWLTHELARGQEAFYPAGLELAFQDLPITAGEVQFELRGRIDRIDVTPDGSQARLIDYKTGRLPDAMAGSGRSVLMGGEKIQIAVYRSALQKLAQFAKIAAVEGEYLHLQPRDGRVIPCAFDDAQLLNEMRALPALLRVVGEGLDNGRFFARTKGRVYPEGHCGNCDYLSICGKDRIIRESNKEQDPVILQFKAGTDFSLAGPEEQ
jgi:ATP-dependent helicase/nuclease subunit B